MWRAFRVIGRFRHIDSFAPPWRKIALGPPFWPEERTGPMSAVIPSDARPVILVVEDEPDERFLAAELLEETGFRVIEAETAERALAILNDRGDEVSVVFSDVRTPGPIGGFELARIIGVTWPRVRVLLTSGDAGDQPSDLRVSATFIPKPWRAADILAWVEEAAGRTDGSASGPDVIGSPLRGN
jgi:CheY-like chemotaxis protein